MNFRQLREQMEWRGITIKDLVCAGGALATIFAITVFLIYGLVAAAIG